MQGDVSSVSAIAIYRSDEAVFFAADGLSADSSGIVQNHVLKLYPLPHLNAIFTHAGAGQVGVVVLDLINRGVVGRPRFDTFDRLLLSFAALCQSAHETVSAFVVAEMGRVDDDYIRATFVLSGWSDAAGKFVAVKTSSFDKEVFVDREGTTEILPAWSVHGIEDFYVNHYPSKCADEFGLNENGLSVFDYLARAISACRAEASPAYVVGGFLQLGYVTRQKTVTWIAHRWPDPVGQLVDPSLGERLPAMPIVIPA